MGWNNWGQSVVWCMFAYVKIHTQFPIILICTLSRFNVHTWPPKLYLVMYSALCWLLSLQAGMCWNFPLKSHSLLPHFKAFHDCCMLVVYVFRVTVVSELMLRCGNKWKRKLWCLCVQMLSFQRYFITAQLPTQTSRGLPEIISTLAIMISNGSQVGRDGMRNI